MDKNIIVSVKNTEDNNLQLYINFEAFEKLDFLDRKQVFEFLKEARKALKGFEK